MNELRARAGRDQLALAQTGGEGRVSDLAVDELGRLEWSHAARAARDPGHLAASESPPPPDQGGRVAPGGDTGDWERQAQAEAEEQLREHPRSGTRWERD